MMIREEQKNRTPFVWSGLVWSGLVWYGHPIYSTNNLDNTLLINQTKWILEGGVLPSQRSITRVVWTNVRTCNLSRPQFCLATHAVQEVWRIT